MNLNLNPVSEQNKYHIRNQRKKLPHIIYFLTEKNIYDKLTPRGPGAKFDRKIPEGDHIDFFEKILFLSKSI